MILIIDNYDSFVYNIVQYIKQMGSLNVMCVRNDEITIDEIEALNPTHIILSPGPKHPKDSGICLEIIEADLNIPILGICLRHQAIAYKFGASIKTLKTPVHGKSSKISVINEGDIFKNLPSSFEVMRYHSLYVDNLPDELEILAKSDVIMAIKHKTKQIYGIQFHPESFFTQYGKKIIENFINLNQNSKNKDKNMENFAPFMKKLQVGYPLDSSDYEIICKAINDKNYDIVQLAGLLVLISEKSLYPDSLAIQSSHLANS